MFDLKYGFGNISDSIDTYSRVCFEEVVFFTVFVLRNFIGLDIVYMRV